MYVRMYVMYASEALAVASLSALVTYGMEELCKKASFQTRLDVFKVLTSSRRKSYVTKLLYAGACYCLDRCLSAAR